MTQYVQVGVSAMRDPRTGEFLESVPLYAKQADLERVHADETLDLSGIQHTLGAMFGQYLKECRKRGVKPG